MDLIFMIIAILYVWSAVLHLGVALTVIKKQKDQALAVKILLLLILPVWFAFGPIVFPMITMVTIREKGVIDVQKKGK